MLDFLVSSKCEDSQSHYRLTIDDHIFLLAPENDTFKEMEAKKPLQCPHFEFCCFPFMQCNIFQVTITTLLELLMFSGSERLKNFKAYRCDN